MLLLFLPALILVEEVLLLEEGPEVAGPPELPPAPQAAPPSVVCPVLVSAPPMNTSVRKTVLSINELAGVAFPNLSVISHSFISSLK